MTWKLTFAVVLFAGSTIAWLSGSTDIAHAESRTALKCDSSQCEFDEQLEQSATMEYLALCTGKAQQYVKKIAVKRKNDKTSCDSRCHGGANDTLTYSKICTNKNPDSFDKIKIVIRCGKSSLSEDSAASLCR